MMPVAPAYHRILTWARGRSLLIATAHVLWSLMPLKADRRHGGQMRLAAIGATDPIRMRNRSLAGASPVTFSMRQCVLRPWHGDERYYLAAAAVSASRRATPPLGFARAGVRYVSVMGLPPLNGGLLGCATYSQAIPRRQCKPENTRVV